MEFTVLKRPRVPLTLLLTALVLLPACLEKLFVGEKTSSYVRIRTRDNAKAVYRSSVEAIDCDGGLLVPVSKVENATLTLTDTTTGRAHSYYVYETVSRNCTDAASNACGHRVVSTWLVDTDYRIYCGSAGRYEYGGPNPAAQFPLLTPDK